MPTTTTIIQLLQHKTFSRQFLNRLVALFFYLSGIIEERKETLRT